MKGQRKTFKVKRPETALGPFKKVSEKKILIRAKELLEPMCEAEGMELVHIEYQREARGRIFRLYIDRPGGVTLDDCAICLMYILTIWVRTDWKFLLPDPIVLWKKKLIMRDLKETVLKS